MWAIRWNRGLRERGDALADGGGGVGGRLDAEGGDALLDEVLEQVAVVARQLDDAALAFAPHSTPKVDGEPLSWDSG
jgi:hypothetical protein